MQSRSSELLEEQRKNREGVSGLGPFIIPLSKGSCDWFKGEPLMGEVLLEHRKLGKACSL